MTHKCLLCGEATTGSIGKAGIYWPNICQACKDREDQYLMVCLDQIASAARPIIEAMSMADMDAPATPLGESDLAWWPAIGEGDN